MTQNTSNDQAWAYDFACELGLEEVLGRFNRLGPWQWQMRENYIEGDYLNVRPVDGLRLKVNEYPQAFIQNPQSSGFRTLARLQSGAMVSRDQVDSVLNDLLREIDASRITAIEPYD